ncbi:hypothetical protein I6F11_13195 [Ensifer sp. NBAIM29]|nr:hypothetical protein [Ensifer sp. NBAIM29]
MVSLANVDVELDGVRREGVAEEPARSRFAPFIALAVVFLPLNAGVLLYTAKNAADVRESREAIAAVKRSIDGLKLQIEKQGRHVVQGAKADELAIVRQQLEGLRKEIGKFDGGVRFAAPASGGSVILSAPGKGVTQRLAPSPGAPAGGPDVAEDTSAAESGGTSIADLPRYERSISPEGKLILRKVR